MGMNFPSPATPGQIYAPPGGPVYRFDDDIWSTLDGGPPVLATPVMHTLLEFIDPTLHADIIAGTSTVDVTVQCQAAAASGYDIFVPAGRYRITGMVTLPNNVTWQGAGRTRAIFYVPNTFNLSALGVLQLGTSAVGNTSLFDVGFEFQQNAAEIVRANLVHYPPAIYAVGRPRVQIDRIRIGAAWDGIDLSGNSGGAYLGRLEIGAFNRGLLIDGALDFVHGESWHFWPFNIAATGSGTMYDVYKDGLTIACQIGNVESLTVDKISSFRGIVEFFKSADTISTRNIGVVQLDGDTARIIHGSGTGSTANATVIGQIYSTKGASTTPDITMLEGRLAIGYLWSFGGQFNSSVSVTGGALYVNGGLLNNVDSGRRFLLQTGGICQIRDCSLTVPGVTRTMPYIESTSGVLVVKNCNVETSSGSGPLIAIGSDNYHDISGNDFRGFSLTTPASSILGRYGPNRLARKLFTPVLTFNTPGDLTYTATAAVGAYYWETNGYRFFLRLVIPLITYTSAAGSLFISGLPAPLKAMDAISVNVSRWSKINLAAGYTDMGGSVSLDDAYLSLTQHGDNIGLLGVTSTHVPSGTTNFEINIDGFIPTQ